MKTVFPGDITKKEMHHLMLGTVIPRPIALVSTVDSNGIKNIAPFSYFNAISSNPPILAFSISRKNDGEKKDTLLNLEETGVCVVNMVSKDIAVQMAISAANYGSEVDEFEKSGFTPVKAKTVEVYGIKESPVRFECKVNKILEFGNDKYSVSLVVCDVSCIEADENIFDENGKIIPHKTGIIGRLGRAYYLEVNEKNIFKIPHFKNPIGFDALPESIKNSPVLTKDEIAQIAALPDLPSKEEVVTIKDTVDFKNIENLHKLASVFINSGEVYQAAELLMLPVYFT